MADSFTPRPRYANTVYKSKYFCPLGSENNLELESNPKITLSESNENKADFKYSSELYLYKTLVERACDAILIFDIQTKKLLEANITFQDLFGYTVAEISQLSIYELIANSKESVDADIETIRLQSQKFLGECTYRHKNGSLREVEVGAHLISYQGREVVCVIARDICDRKAAESTLAKSQERLNIAQKAGKIGIFEWNIQTDEVNWNEELETIFGIPIGSFDNTFNWIQYVHPDDLEGLQREIQQSVYNRSSVDVEFRIIWPDRSVHWIKSQAKVFCDDCGRASRMIGHSVEITERKLAEQTLLESEKRYRLLFNSSSDAIFIHPTGEKARYTKFTEVNNAACQSLGYTREELLQMSPADIAPYDSNLDNSVLEKFRRDGEMVFEAEHITKHGHRYPVEIHCSNFEFEGKPTILAVARDISDRKAAELALKLRDHLLRSVSEATNHLLVTGNETGINLALQTLGKALNVERAYIFRAQENSQEIEFVTQSEWSHSSMNANDLSLHDLSCQYILNDIYSTISQGQVFKYSVKRYSLSSHADYSVLLLPIMINLDSPNENNKFWGIIAFETFQSDRQWTDNEISILLAATASIGAAIQRIQLYEQLEAANKMLQQLINLDYLTQVANRLCFDKCLQEQWQKLSKENSALSLIMCDIDSFKAYNDTYGHLGGDDCLRQVAQTINTTMAKYPNALVARYGGEEFAIILPSTGSDLAKQIAEEVRQAIKALALPHEYSQVTDHVTLSFGVSTIIPIPSQPLQILIAAADYALFQAKEDGRDRVYSIG